MRRVITVNLGGNAFALDEDAYERLRAFLSLTESRLGPNPSRPQILGDVERAVADRLAAGRSAADESVVSDAAMESALTTLNAVPGVEAATLTPTPTVGMQQANSPDYATGEARESEYMRLPVFLLCLFVGWLGVHRFFVGKIGTGILQLVTLGGLFIWAFVDFILILCGAFTDKQGRKVVRWT